MKSRAINLCVLAVFCIVLAFAESGMSLIMVGGREPIEDHGWPTGSVEMANLASRVSWWAGPPFGTGSMYEFQYKCLNTEQFNQALEIFAAIQAPKLEIFIHNGPKDNTHCRDEESKSVDWTFTVWNPEDWDSLYNSPRSFFNSDHPNFRKLVAPPRVDLYISEGGTIVWEQVKVPENLMIVDKRPGSISPEFAGFGLVHAEVFDMTTGEPIPDTEIILAKRDSDRRLKRIIHGKTNELGFCQIPKIPLGHYQVSVVSEGYVSRKQGYYNNERPEYYRFDVRLARPSCVRGVVTYPDGSPIEGVKVSASNILGSDGFGYQCVGDKSGITDAQGRFEICSLPYGLMSVRCRRESLHLKNSIFEQYQIPSDEIELTMTGTGIIRGRVIDKDGKAPSGKVHVSVRPPGEQIGKWGGSRECEADGSFEFIGVPPGDYFVGTDVKLMTEGDSTNAELVSVEAGKTCDMEIVHVGQ
jgi:5-hydroxyisourate hydrolase-like protein (transthyretin family)